ncbi:heterokaryon incompatibility protein-domain-containing protein, partial [Echria macrotheca]
KKRPMETNVTGETVLSWARSKVEAEAGRRSWQPQSVLPTRLISVGKVGESMVRLRKDGDWDGENRGYATLSYCWGQIPQFKATKANIVDLYRGFPLTSLSQTVQDAVEVTRSLGLPFLWVDALCIIQDDEADKSREIEQMATIYRNTAVTIAALSATGATKGFLRVPRPRPQSCEILLPLGSRDQVGTISLAVEEPGVDLCEMPLCHRGWSFQELFLSPRILLYSTDQLLWYSRKAGLQSVTDTNRVYRQNFHAILSRSRVIPSVPADDTDKVSQEEALQQSRKRAPILRFWATIITEYTQRQLTEREDRLRALAGVANHLEERWGDRYIYGMWRNSIPHLLQWRVAGCRTGKRSDRAPTWSWASLDSAVGYFGDL